MKIIVEKNFEEMSKTSLEILMGMMYEDKHSQIAITAGSTPALMYEMLAKNLKDKAPIKDVTFYNFDEIPVYNEEGYGITMAQLREQVFVPCNIPAEQIHALTVDNYKEHDDYIKSVGGLDGIFMGLGADGHFCGNMPGMTKFDSKTVRIDLSGDIKKMLAAPGTEGPDYFVTMGPASVMAVRKLVMFVNGTKKAEAVKNCFFSEVSEKWPSSILQLHPNFTLILDEEAASLVKDLI